MKNKHYLPALKSLFVVALATAASGCVSRTPYLDYQLGNTVNQLKAQQMINPQPASAANPGTGVDAQAAKSGYDAYQKSYRAPEPQPSAFTIGIGGGGSR